MQEEKLREQYLQSLFHGVPNRKELSPRQDYPLSVLSKAGIPRLYQDVELDDFNFGKSKNGKLAGTIINNYLLNIHEAFESCVNILLYGKNGTGKSFLSSIVLKKAFEYYYTIKMCSFVSVINDIFGKTDYAETYANYEFLCIDEVGKETQLQSRANIFLLEQIMRLRDQKGFPTIICTNLDLEEFKTIYGDSILSLMSQGAILHLDGVDKRGEAIVNRDGFRKVMGWED